MLSLRDFDGDGLFTLAKVPPAPVMCKVMNCRIFQSYSYCSALRTNTALQQRHLLSVLYSVCTICNFPSCTIAQGLKITQNGLIMQQFSLIFKVYNYLHYW